MSPLSAFIIGIGSGAFLIAIMEALTDPKPIEPLYTVHVKHLTTYRRGGRR